MSRAERSRAVGEFDVAIEAYRQAYERTPWNDRLKRALAVTYTERAQSVRNEGELIAAEKDLREALGLFPEDMDFRRNLAVVLLERAQAETDRERSRALVEEVRALDASMDVPDRVVRAELERRLDLAFELLERGQLEAGIGQLEGIRRDYPAESEPVKLLAQAHVRYADGFATRQNHKRAAELLDRATSLYAEIGPCDGERCDPEELRTAHYNRCVAWLNARDDARARVAIQEARALGFSFPDVEQALSE